MITETNSNLSDSILKLYHAGTTPEDIEIMLSLCLRTTEIPQLVLEAIYFWYRFRTTYEIGKQLSKYFTFHTKGGKFKLEGKRFSITPRKYRL